MFGSASHLGLSLVRTNGTRDQCASMSPTVCWRHTGTFTSLPIYDRLSLDKYHDFTAGDKLETIFDLEERGRIRLQMLVTNLQRLVLTIDGEYLFLDYLVYHASDCGQQYVHDASLNPSTTFTSACVERLCPSGYS